MDFVGIADYYTLSGCLFDVFVSGRTQCWCENGTKLHTTVHEHHISHAVPHHPTQDVTPTSMQLIDALTQHDQIIYAAALSRFWKHVDRASRKTGVDLRCSINVD